MRRRRFVHVLLMIGCAGLWSGCGRDGVHSKPTSHLIGSVTISGQPVPEDADARIVFQPSGGGGQAPPSSAMIENGRYDAPEVPQGQVTAYFNITRLTGRMIREDGGSPFAEAENLVPVEAQQGIEFEVTRDATKDFNL